VSAVRLDRKVLNASVERRKGKIRNLSPKMVCVNLPGADPMRLRTLRIYRRYAGVDGSILRSKLHCHCNLSPWKNRTYNDHQKNLIVTQKRLHYWFIQLNFDDVGYYSSPQSLGNWKAELHNNRHSPQYSLSRLQITDHKT
jgi:hypothetical protein